MHKGSNKALRIKIYEQKIIIAFCLKFVLKVKTETINRTLIQRAKDIETLIIDNLNS